MSYPPLSSGRHLPRRRTRAIALLVSLAAAAALLAPATARAQADDNLGACVAELRRELPRRAPVSAASFDEYTRGAQDLRPLIRDASGAQPEFTRKIWDYLARLVDAQRIDDGRALLAREQPALQRVAERERVDAATVVAVFGVETDYGKVRGRHKVIDTTLSRACLRMSSDERRGHFFAALRLLQEGLVAPDDFMGSWAGAFGLTQFMPGTFIQYRTDGDADGRVDIYGSVPDALATTARFLRGLGWVDGRPWGVEVRAPRAVVERWSAAEAQHGCLRGGGERCKRLADWLGLGVAGMGGQALADAAQRLGADTPLALLAPAGADGPAWLVTPNYRALWGYNHADAYALAIGLLSDALRGSTPSSAALQRTPWPTDDPGLSRAGVRELQALLRQRGRCEITADGADGPLTIAAIRAEEKQRGWPESGRAANRLLAALQKDATAAAAAAPACADAAAAAAPSQASAPPR